MAQSPDQRKRNFFPVGHGFHMLYDKPGYLRTVGIFVLQIVFDYSVVVCGKPLKVKGQCIVDVKLGNLRQKNLPLVVVNENGSNLLGLDWSDIFGLTENGVSVLSQV